jgi:hypothetical protein
MLILKLALRSKTIKTIIFTSHWGAKVLDISQGSQYHAVHQYYIMAT